MAKQLKIKSHPARQNIKVAVDNCIFTIKDNALHILLIQMKKKPYTGMWALPGGLIKANETLDQAARRVLAEETAVKDVYLEQLYTFSQLDRDQLGRVISAAYFALIPEPTTPLKTIGKYRDVRWWEFGKLPALAYDHNQIAQYAKKRLEAKLEYTNVVYALLPAKFTLSALQQVYEAVLGRDLDKRNFRKRIKSLGLVTPLGEKVRHGAHRPAMLYRFQKHAPQIVNVL